MRAEGEASCTVGNFGPGFDVFSLSLALRGDRVTLTHSTADEVRVTGRSAHKIPTDWKQNVACAAIDALRATTNLVDPLLVEIEKGAPPGSGLGSSASSAAAAVKAFARLHNLTLTPAAALATAGAGEAVATGAAHVDDVAAALYGGLTIVGGAGEDAVVRLRPPPMTLVVVRPDIELPTREMRALLPATLPLKDVAHQLSNVARITNACHTQDARALARALDDRISKPARSKRIPHFDEAERAALRAGALAVVLCGSGPATMAVCADEDDGLRVMDAMRDVLGGETFLTTPGAEVNDPAFPLPRMSA